MDILFFTIPIALFLALIFLGVFVFSVFKGQFEDLDTPAYRILLEEKNIKGKNNDSKQSGN
ncbi:MAG: cbb3-type cytochrome oxidase assembly protein CcoS [Bdellovibrionota bacterium]|nr:cbb3-type cytochrome oxidase assembly protein CcoS [Bdellovibrionota bacterium]